MNSAYINSNVGELKFALFKLTELEIIKYHVDIGILNNSEECCNRTCSLKLLEINFYGR